MLAQLKVIHHYNRHWEEQRRELEYAFEAASDFLGEDYRSGTCKKEMLENNMT